MKLQLSTLLLVVAFALMGCGPTTPAPIEPVLPDPAEISSTDTVAPVEYGASLNEWDEAVEQQSAYPSASADDAVAGQTVAEVSAESESAAYPTETEAVTTAEEVSTANEQQREAAAAIIDEALASVDQSVYLEIMWDALVPADFSAEAISAKYADQIAALEHGSPDAPALYAKMQEEMNNAPVNEQLNGAVVKLPGFIAPLDYSNDVVTEFLLVPYFGACIHVPAPPVNQTVYVKTAEGQGIPLEDTYAPVWIMGEMATERLSTDLAESGYTIQNAYTEPYERGR